MKTGPLLLCVLLLNLPGVAKAERIFEWRLESTNTYSDAFNDVTLDVELAAPSGVRLTVPAFWAGSNAWRARFPASTSGGAFELRSICSQTNDTSLHNRKTDIILKPYSGTTAFDVHGPVRVSRDKRHFEHADGTPFLWLADTWWMGFTRRLHWDEFRQLTADRVSKGFNTIQIVAGLYPDMPAFDERGLGEGGFPWTTNYSHINPEYFDAADKRIQHLCDNGLMPCIVGAWGYHLPWLGMERMKKHWRYLVARWGAYPVVWCVAGEGAMPYYLSADKERDRAFQIKGWTEIAHYLRGTDPYDRLITIHPTDHSRSQVDDPTVIDFEMLQTGHSDRGSIPNTLETLRKALRLGPTMPVFNSEVCYEGIGGTCFDDVQRFFVWTCLLGGAAGHTYGANGIWQVNRQEQPYGKSPHGGNWGTTPWDDAMKLPGSQQTGYAKKFFERFEWWRFESHPEWASWDTNTPLPEITWGDWIWFPEGDPAKDAPAAARFFRRTFDAPEGPLSRATLRLAVDDKFIAYLNGERLGSHNTWRSFREFNIIKRLKPGKNVLAVRAENAPAPHANPAGLLCSLEIAQGARSNHIVSDTSWRASNTEEPGWTNTVFSDGVWPRAKLAAKYGDKPWEKLPDAIPLKYMAPYAAGISATVRIIYLPMVQPIVLHDIDPGSKASWFDPVSGRDQVIGNVPADSQREWKPPSPPNADQDWVLVITK